MLKAIQRMTCRHVWTWSERRQAELCHRCRATRTATPQEAFPPVFAATTVLQPEPEPEPGGSEFLVFNPGHDEAVVDFHARRLHSRLVYDAPAAASTTLPPTGP